MIDLVKEAHRKFLNSFSNEILPELSYSGSGPNYTGAGNEVVTNMFLLRRNTSEPKVSFQFLSKLDDNFTIIKTRWGIKGKDHLKLIEHSVSEKERLIYDSIKKGQECANLAMGELNLILKQMYE